MKLGLGTYSFRWSIGHKDRVPDQPMTALEVLEFAASEGCDVVQYADNLPLGRLDSREIGALAAAAGDLGIALELGTQSFDADEVAQYLGIAERIDAKILRIALDADDAKTPIAELATAFRPLLARARDIGCRIAIENHFNYPSRRMVELLKAIDDPTLGVCLDVANSICAGEWPQETIDVLSPHAINLHLKDYVILPDPYGAGFTITGCPLGEGRTDSAHVLRSLPVRDKTMSVIVEHWLPYQSEFAATAEKERAWTRHNIAAARELLLQFQ